MSLPQIPLDKRFWTKVGPPDANGCTPWIGAVSKNRYGLIWFGGRKGHHLLAHRIAWQLVRGPIPAGMNVLHHCDNPPCVNVEHLFIGTHGDNVRDMLKKGRGFLLPLMRGTEHPSAKLTAKQVRYIRSSSETQCALGERFGVVHAVIGYIRAGKTYRNVL